MLEETTAGTRTTYTIGDDVIAQSTSGVTDYLLYDGHGSTRQLVDSTGAIVTGQEYSYDGYGVMLSDSTTSGAEAAAAADTKMLYAGEQYDANASMYYNRARYYNPANGTFNRVDPYSGNTQDPQSLHKYAYCHNNPINGIDPTGLFQLVNVMMAISITAVLHTMIFLGSTLSGKSFGGDVKGFPDAGIIGLQGSSSYVAAILGSFVLAPLLDMMSQGALAKLFDILYKHGSASVGVEILFSIASSQIAFFVYGGIGATTSGGESVQVYSGLVWNLWNAHEYSGRGGYVGAGIGKFGGSVFGSTGFMDTMISEGLGTAFGKETWGVTFGRNIYGGGGTSATIGMAGYINVGVVDLPKGSTIVLAALWSAATAAIIAPRCPAAILATGIVGSFWPYAKRSGFDDLANRQRPRG